MILLSVLDVFIISFSIIFLFLKLELKIDTGWLFGIILFFDIYGYLIATTFTFIAPIYILFGISVSAILISALSKYELFKSALKNNILKWWAAFTLYMVLSILWTSNPSYAAYKIQLFLVKALLPGLAIYFSYQIFRSFSWKPVIMNGLFYVIVTLLLGQTSSYIGRRTLVGTNPIWIARSSLIFVTVVFFYKNSNKLKRFILAIPGLIAGYLAQSKGPVVGILSSFLYLRISINLNTKYSDTKTKVFSVLKIVFIILIIVIPTIIVINASGIIEGSRFAIFFDYKKLFSELSFLDRVVRYMKAVTLFLNNPFFGTGLGGFSILDQRDYPHNIILEIGSELGLIGLIIWGTILIKSLYVFINNNVLKVLFLQTFIYTLFSGDIGVNYEYILISFLGLALYTETKEGEKNIQGKNETI